MIEPYLEKLRDHFYDQMDRQTSAWLYGSAVTGDWVSGRSDLDLLMFVPKEKAVSFGAKVRSWARTPSNPILDGHVIYLSEGSSEVISLERLANVAHPSSAHIEIIDQWYIKNRSKHLFGTGSLNTDIADVSFIELRKWALMHLQALSKGTTRDGVTSLSNLIWTTSWAARMLMISKGNVCESKQEALRWLANENEEIRHLVNLLLADFYKTDIEASSMTLEQSLDLGKYCIELARREVQTTS